MVDTEIFSRRLDALESYLGRLRSLGEAAEPDYLAEPGIHDLAARYLHLAVEAAIDLANHWIADQGLRTPDTNRDSFTVLEEAGEIEAALAERMRGWAGFATCSCTTTSASITASPTRRSATSSTRSRSSGLGRWER